MTKVKKLTAAIQAALPNSIPNRRQNTINDTIDKCWLAYDATKKETNNEKL